MQVEIRGEYEAKRFAAGCRVPLCIISITCPEDEPVIFAANPMIRGIFRMRFNDIDHDKIPNIPPPQQEDFYGLKDFVDRMDCEVLLVHCGAGISRSAATAAAICEYLGIKHPIWDNSKYVPNHLVYQYACTELGLRPSRGESAFLRRI